MLLVKYTSVATLWASLVIEEASRLGVKNICMAPGSRSTALVAAAARNKKMDVTVHVDERGVGFFALGQAKASGVPSLVITTSGTAVANVLPSVIEASYSHVPMIVISADRPPELKEVGANQSMKQMGIFSDYVRYAIDIPVSTEDIDPKFVVSSVNEAIQHAVHLKGPVHINFQFREPFTPNDSVIDFSAYLASLKSWMEDTAPLTELVVPNKIEKIQLLSCIKKIKNSKKMLILVSEDSFIKFDLLNDLSKHLNCVVFTDASSSAHFYAGLNFLEQPTQLCEQNLEFFNEFDTIFWLGNRLTNRSSLLSLKAFKGILVQVTKSLTRQNPFINTQLQISSDVNDVLKCLNEVAFEEKNDDFKNSLLKKSRQNNAQRIALDETEDIESEISRILCTNLKNNSHFFIANSMAIRLIDRFALKRSGNFTLYSNRGVSGIDGILATSCGIRSQVEGSMVLFVGDLTMLHDLSSLLLLKTLKQPILIILINNFGGRIFEQLEISKQTDIFDSYFYMRHNSTFEDLAKFSGLDYCCVKTSKMFESRLKEGIDSTKSLLIEVQV